MGVTGMPRLSTHSRKSGGTQIPDFMVERRQVRRKPQQVGHRHAIRLSKTIRASTIRASELSSDRTGNLGRKPLEKTNFDVTRFGLFAAH
jgi:hypothetical protein